MRISDILKADLRNLLKVQESKQKNTLKMWCIFLKFSSPSFSLHINNRKIQFFFLIKLLGLFKNPNDVNKLKIGILFVDV